ncbi:MAG: DEAD/DEAH box helicase [Lentisphaeria bacterium]|nr:DEAD/DEAH box helicase [Lentisphaeria bacterium]
MFSTIKKQIRKIFGGPSAPAPAKKSAPASGKKQKSASTDRVKHSHGDKPRRKNDKRPNRSARNDRPMRPRNVEVPVAAKPPRKERPGKLKDVPPAEGKMRFLDLPLNEEVQFGVQNAGFEYCTPIQAMTLPGLLEGRDLAGKAQTGTGKTAAFLLAVFTKLLQNPKEHSRPGQPRALVLAPTRELAMQIHKDAESLALFTNLNNVVVFGGMNHEQQRRQLEEPVDVLIGTPGRIIDYSRSSALDLRKVEILVIDEADRMLDMGVIPDIKRIVAHLPHKQDRQTLLFSATLEDSILRLASGWLVDPIIMESEPEKMVSDDIEQTFYSVLREEKLALTLHILNNEEYERVIIFGNRKDVNLRLQHDLERFGFRVPVLSGDIPQDKRIKILEKFRKGTEKVIIATDVAARGIHVDNVSLVVNYDLPERPEDYVHRIGRTGRAGHKGKSISFLCEYGAYYLPDIEELLGVQFNSTLPPEEMLKLPERKRD